jgi:hypothetical protein
MINFRPALSLQLGKSGISEATILSERSAKFEYAQDSIIIVRVNIPTNAATILRYLYIA